jgi:hypothetical protein
MKRSIVIIACVIAAVVIIPLVAQTARSGNAEKVCPMGQGQGQMCQSKCEEGQNCADCPKKQSGECQGCEKQCEEGAICEDCPKSDACKMQEDAAGEGGAMGMTGQGMGGGCGTGMGQCGQN